MLRRIAFGGIALALVSLSAVVAQKSTWPSEAFNPAERRHVPGQFDYYILALSWSPTHCISATPGRDDAQCARQNGQRFGFILHGLWPQYEKGYPLRCATPWRPFVPEPVIASMHNVMPSRGLVIHEYRQHGTCSGLKPGAYFALARQLYNRIKIPKRYENPFHMRLMSPGEVLRDFLKANPGLKPNMIWVSCTDSGNRLKEVRICMTRDGRPRPCSPSAKPRHLCRSSGLHVPPVRSTWRGEKNATQTDGGARLPQPRIIESPSRF